jgi:hypothetical protein
LTPSMRTLGLEIDTFLYLYKACFHSHRFPHLEVRFFEV